MLCLPINGVAPHSWHSWNFVLTTLLIVSYGVDAVQTSAEPLRGKMNCVNKNDVRIVNEGRTTNGGYNLTQTTKPTVSPTKSSDKGMRERWAKDFTNLRKSRLFGLLGTNFSLAYNLTVGGGNTVGNITVAAAPAPAYYYYAPAPYYPYGYGYADPYGYYNQYGYGYYNPYASYYYG